MLLLVLVFILVVVAVVVVVESWELLCKSPIDHPYLGFHGGTWTMSFFFSATSRLQGLSRNRGVLLCFHNHVNLITVSNHHHHLSKLSKLSKLG